MHLRRFTRLTNHFNKSVPLLKAIATLFIAWYKFSRPHHTLRVAPVMEAGLADHIWTIRELLGAAM